MVSALDSAITGSTYADPEIAVLFSDEAEIQAYLQFEIALAKAQEALGIIPKDTAQTIADCMENTAIDPGSLAARYQQDGIAIPGLVAALREQLPAEVASYLHHGVTSHDVIDSGLVLRLKLVCNLLLNKNSTLTGKLKTLADEHRNTLTIARTRNQNAAPTVFGLKVVNWLEPLLRQQDRLSRLLPNLLRLQLGGSVGTLSALGPKANELCTAMAEELDLSPSNSPWHVQRDNIVEFGNWLSTTAGLIGKMAQNMLLLTQSEVGELRFNEGGKSSTLPNKTNPVLPEILVALASYCQSLSNVLNQTLLANHERDGVSMATENLTLAPLACAAGASLSLASQAIDSVEVKAAAMQANIALDNGRILAEAATFELSKSMERAEAANLVAQACAASINNETNMIDELSSLTSADIDWQALKEPANALGMAEQIINKVLNE